MSKFQVTVTQVKATDTVEKFTKRVLKANLNEKSIAKYLKELDNKEGAWGFEKCCEIRDYLESFDAETDEIAE